MSAASKLRRAVSLEDRVENSLLQYQHSIPHLDVAQSYSFIDRPSRASIDRPQFSVANYRHFQPIPILLTPPKAFLHPEQHTRYPSYTYGYLTPQRASCPSAPPSQTVGRPKEKQYPRALYLSFPCTGIICKESPLTGHTARSWNQGNSQRDRSLGSDRADEYRAQQQSSQD